MAAGDLTASTPIFVKTEADLKTGIDLLNLAATTDHLFVIPHNGGFLYFKVERAAA